MVECDSMPDEPDSTHEVFDDAVKELVGRNISRRLDDLRLSQAELARRLGVDPSTVSLYVRGGVDMPITRYHRIGVALDLEPCGLLADDEAA